MAGRKITSADTTEQFAICVVYPNGIGWLIGGGQNGTGVKIYPTMETANKAISQIKRDSHYSWSFPLEARSFSGSL